LILNITGWMSARVARTRTAAPTSTSRHNSAELAMGQ
jgi:hypothetical protein